MRALHALSACQAPQVLGSLFTSHTAFAHWCMQADAETEVAAEHVLDLFAAFALPCTPGAAACMVHNAVADGDVPATPCTGRGRASLQAGTGAHSLSQYVLPEEEQPPSRCATGDRCMSFLRLF